MTESRDIVSDFWLCWFGYLSPRAVVGAKFSVYVVAASPLIVSTDIRNMTDTMKQLLLNADAIALNQQTTPPGDVVGTIPGKSSCKPCAKHTGCLPCDEVRPQLIHYAGL